MSNYLLIRHKVRDFNEWKPGYDDHLTTRESAGLVEKQLLRGNEDPNEVVLLFQAADLDKARAFIASPDLREVMQKYGVIGMPDISFLND
jgi:hypothetical protein